MQGKRGAQDTELISFVIDNPNLNGTNCIVDVCLLLSYGPDSFSPSPSQRHEYKLRATQPTQEENLTDRISTQ